MSTVPQPLWLRASREVRRFAASFVRAPACALCGGGDAQTGWHLDPTGGMHGRCPGCLDEPNAGRTMPKPGFRPTN